MPGKCGFYHPNEQLMHFLAVQPAFIPPPAGPPLQGAPSAPAAPSGPPPQGAPSAPAAPSGPPPQEATSVPAAPTGPPPQAAEAAAIDDSAVAAAMAQLEAEQVDEQPTYSGMDSEEDDDLSSDDADLE